jgi:transcriptional regulator with XRE-family HTH domain
MSTDDQGQTVARLVDQLFQTYRRSDGQEYTYQEVAAALDGELDPTMLGRLRRGQVPNPSRNTLKLLCLFFQVSPTYFFPELKVEPTLSPEQQLQHALRSLQLSPEAQASLHVIINALQAKTHDQSPRGEDDHERR